ncbi:VPLPA-CTERM sorting domain-containing protein [Oceanicoccus sp. KOV_DT_Chl]|uniref:VPLPA-CTERM sorting domain-containing protein n=1 Tax=Oceanicoccus sp. KOV_DT_Chl TaxID=1904639 RepID=UPI000C7A53A0|nr:VPLPA-CTERM sorting domain-containing protein [Oceanicoccus sp. KOV_DT_Chl]
MLKKTLAISSLIFLSCLSISAFSVTVATFNSVSTSDESAYWSTYNSSSLGAAILSSDGSYVDTGYNNIIASDATRLINVTIAYDTNLTGDINGNVLSNVTGYSIIQSCSDNGSSSEGIAINGCAALYAYPGTYALYMVGNADPLVFDFLIGGSTNFQTTITGSGIIIDTNLITVSSVPVPAAAWLFGSALIGLFGLKRKNNRK